jgi:hypothetical protein
MYRDSEEEEEEDSAEIRRIEKILKRPPSSHQ